MKNVSKIILILTLASNALYFGTYAAAKRKAEVEPENESHCSKRTFVLSTEQAELDLALFNAARTGNSDAVEELLNMNANPRTLINGCTALHIAARNHHFNCVWKLLESGKIGANTVADNFMTPLHEAVCSTRGPKLDEIRFITNLIDEGANANAQNSDKNTPLHLAVMHGHDHYVVALLGPYLDHTLRNADGKTPLMIAEEKGFEAIMGLLNKKDNSDEMDIS